jgi:phosphatidylserine synthase
MHEADLALYRSRHGRLRTSLYANRRLIVLGMLVMPLCILVIVSDPWLMLGLWMTGMMTAAVSYQTHRNWRDD